MMSRQRSQPKERRGSTSIQVSGPEKIVQSERTVRVISPGVSGAITEIQSWGLKLRFGGAKGEGIGEGDSAYLCT